MENSAGLGLVVVYIAYVFVVFSQLVDHELLVYQVIGIYMLLLAVCLATR